MVFIDNKEYIALQKCFLTKKIIAFEHYTILNILFFYFLEIFVVDTTEGYGVTSEIED